MNPTLITVAAIVALAALYVLLPVVIHTFQRYRNKRVLKCPESEGLAEVDIDAPHAAVSSVFGRPFLRIKNCTLWPKRKGCDQDCIRPP